MSMKRRCLLGHVLGINERVIDADNFHSRVLHSASEHQATNATKAVDADLGGLLATRRCSLGTNEDVMGDYLKIFGHDLEGSRCVL